MKTFEQFYSEHNYLVEIKMSRVLKHFTQEEYPVGIITAFRFADVNDNEISREENVANNKSLASFLRSKDYGFVYVDGAWIENKGKKNEKSVSEDSIFVMAPRGTSFAEFSNNLQSQAKKYDQDTFLAYDHENKIVKIINQKGVVDKTLKKFRLGQAADAFTRLRRNGNNGEFFFERFRFPINWIRRMALTDTDTSKVML